MTRDFGALSAAAEAAAPAHSGLWREIGKGWPLILAAFLPVALHSLPNYGLGALIGPIAEDFGVDVSRVAAWSLFWSLGAIACALVVGRAVDLWGARRVILCGLPLFAVVLAALSVFAEGLASLLFFAVMTGVACTGIGSIPCGRILADRFDAGLGTAFGLMAAGIGMAALAGPLLLQQLADSFGWRSAYAAMSAGALLVWPIFWFASKGASRPVVKANFVPKVRILPLIRTRTFALMAAGTFLFGMVVTGASVSMILFLQSHGFERPEAAAFAGLFGVSTIAGRILTGFALDRVRLHIADFTALVLAGLALCFVVMSGSLLPAVLASIAVFGFAVGAEADCLSYSVVRLFGREVYGRLYGLLGVGALLAGAGFGPVIFNLIVEQAGGFAAAFGAWSVLTLASAFFFFLVRTAPYANQDASV